MHGLLLTAGLCAILGTTASSFRLICYYDRDAATRDGFGKMTPANIDPNLCTHIIFAFANIEDDELTPVDSSDTTLYTELNNLKTSNPYLKTMLSVGGPGFRNKKFRELIKPQNGDEREAFINSAVTLLKAYGFNGLDIDWRSTTSTNLRRKDRFTTFCQEIKTRFTAESLLLSASVSGVPSLIDAHYEVSNVAAELDFINVLTFEYHDSSAAVTAHHSPLGALSSNPNDPLTTKSGMERWVAEGAPAGKLNMGVATFGVAWTLQDAAVNGVGVPVSGSGEMGCYHAENGIWSYADICLYIKGGSLHTIVDQSVPYAVTEGQWVGYDNRASLTAKVQYLKDEGYGGAAVWALDLDDFSGYFCGEGNSPLITHLSPLLPGPTPTQPPTTTSSSGRNPNFCATKVDDLYPIPDEPNFFYHCAHQRTFIKACPPGLVFNVGCKCCDHTP